MHDPALMRVVHGLRDLGEQACRRRGIIHEPGRAVGKTSARDPLHAEESLSVMLPDLEDGDDVRVVQGGDGLGLILEPTEIVIGGEGAGPDQFEGDDAVEADLAGFVDDTHATLTEDLQQFVIAEITDADARHECVGPGFDRIAGWCVDRGLEVGRHGGLGGRLRDRPARDSQRFRQPAEAIVPAKEERRPSLSSGSLATNSSRGGELPACSAAR